MNLKKYKLNILAPLSVAMVVITLGAAFGVLSGRGAFIGMVSTCFIVTLTALIGGSRYGVSSPTGPMTAAIAVILMLDQQWLQTHTSVFDAVALMNLTLLFAGGFLLLFVLFRLHRLVRLVPNLVISGFVNGIALLIIISQFKAMSLGFDWALMFATFVLAMMISRFGRSFSHIAFRIISSSFCVIVLMSLVALLLGLPVSFIDLSVHGDLNFDLPHVVDLDFETMKIVLPLAFELALIALLDTMLTSVIMDKKTRTKTDMNRELFGQSATLFSVSLFGGIPGAQSTVPSMMLHQEAGHHRFSKMMLAGFCVLGTFVFVGFLQYVPLAVFGGVILKIAFDVADFTSLRMLINCPKKQRPIRFAIIFGTCLSTVLISLNLAVIAFTFGFVLWNNFAPLRLRIPDLQSGKESEGFVDEL